MESKEPVTWTENYIFQIIGSILFKITHLALVQTIPPSITDQLNKTEELYLERNPKIKNSNINDNYENGGLKNVNIVAKISGLQSPWIKRLFDENFHE